mmetsp:Transcript_8987/g.17567  ORF Transcript_8987/g.17567 Transcript_8987/m.17567 type:complete len:97 (+) Transcript_8987:432-722(+)
MALRKARERGESEKEGSRGLRWEWMAMTPWAAAEGRAERRTEGTMQSSIDHSNNGERWRKRNASRQEMKDGGQAEVVNCLLNSAPHFSPPSFSSFL